MKSNLFGLLIIFTLFTIQEKAFSQTITYTNGKIPSYGELDFSQPSGGVGVTIDDISPCRGELTLSVPQGKQIASLIVEYTIKSSAPSAFPDMLYSYISSPTLERKESEVNKILSITGDGRQFTRSLDFAIGATGNIVFELHVFRDNFISQALCSWVDVHVPNETWKLIPVYEDIVECTVPDFITVKNANTSVTLNWHSPGDEFEVEYGLEGFEHGTGSLISSITTKQLLIENLNLGSTYEFYVRSVCANNQKSEWSQPIKSTIFKNKITYDQGKIASNYRYSYEYGPKTSVCPAQMTLEVPQGKKIKKLQVEYTVFTSNEVTVYSYISSPTLGVAETEYVHYSSNGQGEHHLSRYLYFAVGATGEITFNLNLFRDLYLSGASCSEADVYVESGNWKLTATYEDLETCPRPLFVKVLKSQSNALVSWNTPGTEFEISNGYSYVQGSEAIISGVHTNPFLIENLEIGGNYLVKVRNVCGEQKSAWSLPLRYITNKDAIYLGGEIASFYTASEPSTQSSSPCAAQTKLTVPIGKKIENLSVAYRINGDRYSHRAVFKSPTLGMSDDTVISGDNPSSTNGRVTRDLDFAVGATGEVIIELHSFTTSGTSGCSTDTNYIMEGTWSLVPTYEDDLCYLPYNLTAETTNTSATISWESTEEILNFEIEYGPKGFQQGTGTIISNYTQNSFLIENLITNAAYDFYVRGHCQESEISDWSLITFVATDGIAYHGEIPTAFMFDPTCPEQITINVPEGKQIESLKAEYKITATNGAKISDQRSYIESPTLGIREPNAFLGVGNHEGTYQYSRYLDFAEGATGQVVFELHASTFYGTPGCSTDFNYIPYGTWILTPTFEDILSCPIPKKLNVETSGTNTTFTWTSTGSEFELEYGPVGFIQGQGTMITGITTNSVTIQGLTTNYKYDFYVRNVCNQQDISPWSDPKTFTQGYCSSTSVNFYNELVINKVKFAGIDNSTTTHFGYNFFEDQVGQVQTGQTYPFSIEILPAVSNSIVVYIDWNQNGLFDGNNERYTIVSGNSNTSSFTHNITIPEDALPGQTRMRVILHSGTNSNPCGNYNRGETEDYIINVSSDMITWTGSEWINGLPISTKPARISGALNVGQDYPSFEVQKLYISPQGTLNLLSGETITVNGLIHNQGTADNFTIYENANLIQNSEIQNIGNATVYRTSQPMLRLDYSLWSSPVHNQGIKAFSPMTLWNRFYTYEPTGYTQAFTSENESDKNFEIGKGYLIRSPNDWSSTEPNPYLGMFKGRLQNGTIYAWAPYNSFASVGNPYPSNIDADLLLADNENVNTIFFWTNTNAPQNGSYENVGNNYAYYNLTGGTSAENSTNIPNGIISVGQGFIVETGPYNGVVYKNTMRTTSNANSFRATSVEKNRFWLNLYNENDIKLNQILIGYLENATDEFDSKYDAKLFGYDGSSLYSSLDNIRLIVQGRALPFQTTDVVPLGLNVMEKGKYKIALFQFDGLFLEGQTKILIKDKMINIVHNLMESDYDFESNAGEFNDRFEIIYEADEQMNVNDLNNHTMLIYQHNQQIVIDAKTEKIASVELFDLQGRQIHINTKVNASNYKIDVTSAKAQVFIVKVKTINGKVVTKKIIIA